MGNEPPFHCFTCHHFQTNHLSLLTPDAQLLSPAGFGESANIAFLERRMGTQFVKRKPPFALAFNTSDIRSGDFLALSKIKGKWGGFETLQKWVTGSYAGHTAVALRDEKDDLWVIEGGQPDEQVRTVFPRGYFALQQLHVVAPKAERGV
jgi:hypothetical protein